MSKGDLDPLIGKKSNILLLQWQIKIWRDFFFTWTAQWENYWWWNKTKSIFFLLNLLGRVAKEEMLKSKLSSHVLGKVKIYLLWFAKHILSKRSGDWRTMTVMECWTLKSLPWPCISSRYILSHHFLLELAEMLDFSLDIWNGLNLGIMQFVLCR